MSVFRVSELRNSSILRVYTLRDTIQTDPEYQRMSEVWTTEKKQLLIDSILNDFDIPKLYLHEFDEYISLPDGRRAKYAIIDGKQRLEAIWSFIDNKLPLGDDILYYDDPSIDLKKKTYGDIAKSYPRIKDFFDSYVLPIITVATDDIDMIEEMFSRLNEAVPLNAAEKRNALGGPMAKTIRRVASHLFFKTRVLFSNKRYHHRELSCKLLWLCFTDDKIIDTKKAYLDDFVIHFKEKQLTTQSKKLEHTVSNVLDQMNKVFQKNDPLLKTLSMPVIYFLVFKDAFEDGWLSSITRNRLLAFDEKRKQNRKIAESDLGKADYALLEFDRMAIQGTNDGVSISFRRNTLAEFLKK